MESPWGVTICIKVASSYIPYRDWHEIPNLQQTITEQLDLGDQDILHTDILHIHIICLCWIWLL